MTSKRQTEYRTRLLVLEGSAEDAEITRSNREVQEALNDTGMHDDGFELDQMPRLRLTNKFTNFMLVLIVFSRAMRE